MTKTVAMFGSARPGPGTIWYEDSKEAARKLSAAGWTIATGGGPGLMQACNEGALEACSEGSVCSLGYSIYLPFEAATNHAVQEDTHHKNFFTRLEQFSQCDAFIALPGGWGTLLEILTVIQLLQVDHLKPVPLVLAGAEWHNILSQCEFLLKKGRFVGVDEGPFYTLARTAQDAADQILAL